ESQCDGCARFCLECQMGRRSATKHLLHEACLGLRLFRRARVFCLTGADRGRAWTAPSRLANLQRRLLCQPEVPAACRVAEVSDGKGLDMVEQSVSRNPRTPWTENSDAAGFELGCEGCPERRPYLEGSGDGFESCNLRERRQWRPPLPLRKRR